MADATDESMANGDDSADGGGINGSPAVAPVKRGRGRPPKAGGPAVKKPPAPTPAGAKKRGRPPKAKRGRPTSVPRVATMRASIQHAPPTSPRRVLSPSANAAGNSNSNNNDVGGDEPVVKRGRGRPKKAEVVAKAPKAAYIPTGKPRGRPPKARSASASSSPPKKAGGSSTTGPKKRGRPPKSALANGSPKKATPAAGGRKRGRPPKAAKKGTIASMDQVADVELGATTSSGMASGAPAKKRGRPRKAAHAPVATVNDANDGVEEQESDADESFD